MLLFGGWANRWFGDAFVLDVGCVVGPPYAIMAIEPNMGPITGGTRCHVEGIDFVNTTQVVLRFSSKKGAVDVTGQYISPTEVICDTPSFDSIGAGEVDVRISLKGDSFTTTFVKYRFFAVTDARRVSLDLFYCHLSYFLYILF